MSLEKKQRIYDQIESFHLNVHIHLNEEIMAVIIKQFSSFVHT